MKKFLIIFLIVILSVIIGGVTYILTFDVNSYKGQIERVLVEKTGYPIAIQGKMKLAKSLMPTLVIEDIEIKNATGFSQPLFLKAARAEVSFDLIAFFKNIINVQKIALSDVDVYLQVNALGQDNWSRISAKNTSDKKAAARPVLSKSAVVQPLAQTQIDVLTLSQVRFSYENDHDRFNDQFLFSTISVKQLVNIDGEFVYKNQRFNFSGSVKNLLQVITTHRNLNFSFDIKGLGGSAKLSGVCRDLKRFKDDVTLNVTAKGGNLQKIYAFFLGDNDKVPPVGFSLQLASRLFKNQLLLEGALDLTDKGVNLSYNIEQDLKARSGKGRLSVDIVKPEFINQYGLQPFSLQTTYNIKWGEKLDILNLSAMFDETDIDGAVSIDLKSAKPVITGSLHSHYFKLKNVIAEKAHANKAQNSGANKGADSLFSATPFDLSFMNKADAVLALTIDNLAAQNWLTRYPVVFLNVQLKDAKLNAQLLEESTAAGGKLVGKLAIDAQNIKMPAWDLELVGEGLEFNQANALKKQMRSGKFDLNLFLTATGDSQKAILSSLNGQALLSAGQLEILSPLVADLFAESDAGNAYRAPQDLFIKCAVLNADIKDGVITLDKKAAIEASRFNMLIDGNINLKKETIDMRFIPQKSATKAGQIGRVISAVSLKGRLSEPKPGIEADVSSLLENILPAAGRDEDVKNNAKKALLDSYTTPKKTTEEVSVCRVAANGMKLKTIDAYLGRLPITEPAKPQVKQPEKPQQTKAQKLGRDLLHSLSDILNDEENSVKPAANQ